jgi:hypothetical protein
MIELFTDAGRRSESMQPGWACWRVSLGEFGERLRHSLNGGCGLDAAVAGPAE